MVPRCKVLIVDPETIIGDLLASAFPANSFQVFNANSSRDAYRLTDLHVPNLAVIDPSISEGFELIDSLRSNGAKVLALSACSDALKRAQAQGVEHIIDKKEGLRPLVDAVRAVGFSLAVAGKAEGRILIVDDETDLRNLVTRFLSQRGYTCLSAGSGKEALEVLPRDVSQMVVVVDVMMPGMGGLELLKEVKSRHPRLTVIMMTAVTDREIARRALELGAFDYLVKPIDLDALESSIVIGLSHAEYQRRPWWKRLGA